MVLIYRRIGKAIIANIVSFILITAMGYWSGVKGHDTCTIESHTKTVYGPIVCHHQKVGKLRGDVARESDQRISHLEEMINSIQVVKMYCWESFMNGFEKFSLTSFFVRIQQNFEPKVTDETRKVFGK